MGKSASDASTKEPPEGDQDLFDPFLGMLLGETWWKLGKNFARALIGTEEQRNRYLEEWSEKLRTELTEDEMTESVSAITTDALTKFITTVMPLLEKKYDGENIAKDVRRLTKRGSDANVYDRGQYLDIQEPEDVFWANEYEFLFSDLIKPDEGRGWLNAVTKCADPDCNLFFIKQRKDQRFHTDACRTRTANREAYNETRSQRTHTKRGRPRLRR